MQVTKKTDSDGFETIRKVYKRDQYEVVSLKWKENTWAVYVNVDGKNVLHSGYSEELKDDADAEAMIHCYELLSNINIEDDDENE